MARSRLDEQPAAAAAVGYRVARAEARAGEVSACAARCSSTSCVQVESMIPRKALAWDRVRVRVRIRVRVRV